MGRLGLRLSIFVVVATVLILNLYGASSGSDVSGLSDVERVERVERTLLGGAGIAVCGSMIFFGRLWTDYILPFGFWESFASDAGNAGSSAPAIALIGWILLALMGVGVLTN